MASGDKQRLTKSWVDNLPENTMAWDSDVPGFLVRARNRAVTFLVTYRHQGRQRWYASTAVAAGYSLHIAGKLLGQTQAATTHRYAHLADAPLRKATEAVDSRIQALMAASPGGGGDVVKLAGKRC